MENQVSHQFMEEDVIDLKDIYFLLRQKVWKLVATFVLGAVVAGLITTFLITPKYEATSSLYVVSASNDSVVNLSDLQIGTSLTKDYEALLLGRPMMESVIQNLELEDDGISVGTLKSMITISNPEDTRILRITVESASPQQAMEIANEMAKLGMTWLPEVMDSDAPNLAEEAIVPVEPSSPSLPLNIAIGAIVFVVIYAGFVIVRFMMNDTIRSSEEFERYFDLVPLAVVPEVENIPVNKSANSGKKKMAIDSKKGA